MHSRTPESCTTPLHIICFTLYFLVQDGDVVFVEGEGAREQSVQDDAAGPDIDGSSFVLSFADDFGGGVGRASTGGFEEFAVFHKVGESEVADFDEVILVDEDVFGFEVAMGDMILMDVLDSVDDLLKVEAGLFLVNGGILDVFVEFSLGGEFHDHENVICGIKHLVQLDDVGVVDELQDSYFPFHLRYLLITFDIMFLFFIFFLLIILTATSMPVRSCLAPSYSHAYF